MSISLFSHNETAYFAAASMLKEIGKAAIIHPTGTGKSFIGFKLCEDNSSQQVCWLAPSEHIFSTQLENLTATGADVPKNIAFVTYAKLMMMEETELLALQPEFIILDEFHRCGAEAWGEGVQRLISLYPKAKLLGLSATNIRYLDNQRDMADELFDGNIASIMTLGEAIVKGILNAPTYVLSVYAYQKDYEKLKSRVHRTKNRAVRDEAGRYLDALRRTLECADGLDVIFEKYMTDHHGKYLVFCANVEHMQEMMSHVPEWFGRIDCNPHVYSVNSDDPTTSRVFRNFKNDSSDHLKLLFCIDMLNEGIHVEDVNGVILFRPTVSPIIYKQQIGRALSASKTSEPVIFDVVNNIENLYSIGVLEQEIQAAVNYYRFFGDNRMIVNDRFKLIDEVRNARELFEKLNDTLGASWDLMYEFAREYYDLHGDLNVARRYKTPDGYALGSWIQTQRKIYAGEQYGNLSEERIDKLNAIGMRWGSYLDLSWERYYRAAKYYYEKHENLMVPVTENTDDGLALGAWIARIRTYKKSNIRNSYLSPDRVAALEQIGMVWDVPDYIWEENYAAAMQYYREHGNLDIPTTYVSSNGIRLGAWIFKMREIRDAGEDGKSGLSITQEQIDRLDCIGMIWDSKYQRAWTQGYEEAKKYFEEHGNSNVPAAYVTSSGYHLGRWIRGRRTKGKDNHTFEQQMLLDSLDFQWNKPDAWEVRYALAKSYYEEHGDLYVPAKYQVNGMWLSKWINEQRNIYIGNRSGKTLTAEQIQRLEAIGMEWGSRNQGKWSSVWEESYLDAKTYFEKYGDLKVPDSYTGSSGKRLSPWIARQRTLHRNGKLTTKQIRLLEEIGMVWEVGDSWENGYRHAEHYYEVNGNLEIPYTYICEDGYRLGNWIAKQRINHNNPQKYHMLTAEQIRQLELLGIRWKLSDSNWQIGYEHAKKYIKMIGDQKWRQSYVSPDGFQTGNWIRKQVQLWKHGGMKTERWAALHELGLIPEDLDHPRKFTVNSPKEYGNELLYESHV